MHGVLKVNRGHIRSRGTGPWTRLIGDFMRWWTPPSSLLVLLPDYPFSGMQETAALLSVAFPYLRRTKLMGIFCPTIHRAWKSPHSQCCRLSVAGDYDKVVV